MKFILSFELLFCFSIANSFAQGSLAKSFNQFLNDSSSSIAEITVHNALQNKFRISDPTSIPYLSSVPQSFVKNKNGLFALVEGTGRVYKVSLEDGKVLLNRIDSTIFFGYSFGSYNFSYRDTLYSFGGYGIWRVNGQLRFYLPKNGEWEVEPIDQEIPFSKNALLTSPLWYSSFYSQLWIGTSIYSSGQ